MDDSKTLVPMVKNLLAQVPTRSSCPNGQAIGTVCRGCLPGNSPGQFAGESCRATHRGSLPGQIESSNYD